MRLAPGLPGVTPSNCRPGIDAAVGDRSCTMHPCSSFGIWKSMDGAPPATGRGIAPQHRVETRLDCSATMPFPASANRMLQLGGCGFHERPHRRGCAAAWTILVKVRIGPSVMGGPVGQISTASEIASASSSSTPKYRTVLSILVWPSKSCTARRLPVFR